MVFHRAIQRNLMMSTNSHSFQDLVRPDLVKASGASNLNTNEMVKDLMANGRKIYHFAFGQSPFPVMAAFQAALKENVHQMAYVPVAGIAELRRAICDFHYRFDNLKFHHDQVIVGPGTKELIYLLMCVFNGDIYVLSPSWTTYKPQAKLAGHAAKVIETCLDDKWRLQPEVLEKVFFDSGAERNKLLILCNPDNPTGTIYPSKNLQQISDVLRRHNVLVLSDEIYARLEYNGKHDTIARYYPEGTILSTGMSKWPSAGGWRVGYNIFPPELNALKVAVRCAASHTYSCAPAPMQYAVAKALTMTEECNEYIFHTTRILCQLAAYCCRELQSLGVKLVPPSGGYYCFPDFECLRPALERRGIKNGQQFTEAIFTEANVALMSGGPAFLRPDSEFTVRLCFTDFDGDEALKASMKIGRARPLTDEFLKYYCKNVVEGVEVLKNWVIKNTECQ